MSNSKIYKDFSDKSVFTLEEVIKKYKADKKNANNILHYLIKKGIIGKVKRGLYYTIPINTNGEYQPEAILVAGKLSPQYFLGYHTALEVNGAGYSKFNAVYVSSNNHFKKFSFKGITYFNISPVNNDFTTGITKVNLGYNTIRVSDRGRTLIDCIDKLKYAGGLEEYLKSVKMFPSINSGKVFRYVQLFGQRNLYNKAGWVLSVFKDRWKITETQLDKFRKQKSDHIVYLSDNKRNSKFNSEWNIITPGSVESIITEV